MSNFTAASLMTRWDAQRELVACARSRLDDLEVFRKNTGDPDTLASLHEDHGRLSAAISVITEQDPVTNMVARSCDAGAFARCVSIIRARLEAMIMADQPESDEAQEALALLVKLVKDDQTYLQFMRDLEGGEK